MARYYNRTRSPLTLSLPSGPCVVPPKTYVNLEGNDAGCSSVVKQVKKGMLVPPLLRAIQSA